MEDLNQLMVLRREKLKRIKEMDFEPYPHVFQKSHFSEEIINNFQDFENKSVSVSGRMMSIRLMGKAAFCHLQDQNGRIQIYIRQDHVGDKQFELFKILDIGDIIGVAGDVFKTRTEEISVLAKDVKLLSKSIRPLPIVKEKIEESERIVYDQFSDIEMRYRQRYIDLIVNPEVKEVFVKRSKIISAMRQFLDESGFLEVETPILQPIFGGAAARPFVTHHNTLDIEMYLRIANELYLKRLIVGGNDRVYEFAKDFRNEGMDRFHNPEFTMVELYVAYKDYIWMMDFFEKLLVNIANTVFGTNSFEYQGNKIDLSPPWKRMTMFESIKEYAGVDISSLDESGVRKAAKELKLSVDDSMGYGKLVDEIFSEFVEPKLIQPTFIIDYPIEMSPLAKKHRNNPKLTERFEPFIGGKEVGNAFTELNDPIDQRERFVEQMKLRERGDEEAHSLDEDYIRALEYGMPPTAGLGIGIDRLVMLLTNSASIRDVIYFPQMKPESAKEN